MPMTGSGRFDADAARRWRATVVPSWVYRWVVPALWAAAFVVSMESDDAPCRVDDPSVCGPDRWFSVMLVVCFGALVTQWWLPRLGWLLGVVFAFLELRYDGLAPAGLAWLGFGAVCLGLLVWSGFSRAAQRRVSASVRRVGANAGLAEPIGVTLRLLIAAVLLVAGVAALGIMRWMDGHEADHLSRAVRQDATVRSTNGDGDVEIVLPDGSRRTVTPYDKYADGAVMPVWVDGDWVRMVAEPADNAYWYTIGLGAWLAAGLVVVQDLQRRRAARVGPAVQGVAVRVAFDDAGDLVVFALDEPGQRPVAFLSVDVDDPDLDAALDALDDDLDGHFRDDLSLDHPLDGAPEQADPYQKVMDEHLGKHNGDAVLSGELVEGAWPVVVTAAGTLRPRGPLSAPRWTLWRASGRYREPYVEPVSLRQPADRPPRGDWASREIEPARTVPELPWTVRMESGLSVGDWLYFAGAIPGPVLLWWLLSDVTIGLVWSLMGAGMLCAGMAMGLTQLARRLVVDSAGLVVGNLFLRRFVAWRDLRELSTRRYAVLLRLAGRTGELVLRFDGRKGRPNAEQVAAVIEGVRRTGEATGRSSARLSWTGAVMAGYVLLTAAVVGRHFGWF